MNHQKKPRGLSRYYKKLVLKNSDWSELNFTDADKAWFDLWHTHFDWDGYGNNNFKARKPHLDQLIKHFDSLAEKAKTLKKDFQIWALLHDYNSYNDALYLHTSNPNKSNFPVEITGLSTTNTLKNTALKEYLKGLNGFEMLYGQNERFCIIYKKDIGIGFEGCLR